MAQAMTTIVNKPAWVDLASSDAEASRNFYSKLFGWQVEVNPDPQYGGYGLAKTGGKDAAGIGPKMDPNAPTAWNLYIGTDDIEELTRKVQAAGGTAVMAPFDVGEQGRMAVYQDPAGAFISAWQGTRMGGFQTDAPNSFGWAELNARGVEKALPFYQQVFGWTTRRSEMGEGQPPYTEFLLDGQSIAGAWEMNPMVPAEVPSYWQVYFAVEDVDAAYRKALDLGATGVARAPGVPGRTLRDRERPGGRELRSAQDGGRADRSTALNAGRHGRWPVARSERRISLHATEQEPDGDGSSAPWSQAVSRNDETAQRRAWSRVSRAEPASRREHADQARALGQGGVRWRTNQAPQARVDRTRMRRSRQTATRSRSPSGPRR